MSDLPAPKKVLEQIQKLIALSSKNDNENEAAAAMAKAQSLLTEYNLTMEIVGEASVGDGAREQVAIEGGFFKFQQELWEHVAELNFCLYWHQRVRNSKGLKNKYKEVRKWMFHNYVVGKKVNVAATIAMQSYLEQTCTRLAKEHTQGMNNKHNLSNWANSYRRGIVARVCRKLRERRNEALKAEEERMEQVMRAAAGTISTSTSLVLSTYIDKETDANLDFIHGEGWSAKQAAYRAAEAEERRCVVRHTQNGLLPIQRKRLPKLRNDARRLHVSGAVVAQAAVVAKLTTWIRVHIGQVMRQARASVLILRWVNQNQRGCCDG